MSRQCSGCGRIVDDPHNCLVADEADIKVVRDRVEATLRKGQTIPKAEASEVAVAIDELIKARIHYALKRR